MSVPADILGFIKSHADVRVLSVYIDGSVTDPAKRHEWRTMFRHSIDSLRARFASFPPADRDAFESCVARVEERLPVADDAAEHGSAPWSGAGTHGWMALSAEDGEMVDARLSVAQVPLVTWGDCATIVPFLAATRTDDAVIVQVDLDHAIISRLHRGVVQVLESMTADRDTDEVGSHMGDAPRQGFHMGTRGDTRTDDAQRQRREAHERLMSRARRTLAVIAGSEARIVVGGTGGAVAHFIATLPNELAARCAVSEALHMTTALSAIPTLADAALLELLTRHELEALQLLDRRAHLTRNAAFGYEAVAAAATAGAIERLFVSETLWRNHLNEIEALVQRALRSHTRVDVVTPRCASTLDASGGIAAELRFAVAMATTPELAHPASV